VEGKKGTISLGRHDESREGSRNGVLPNGYLFIIP